MSLIVLALAEDVGTAGDITSNSLLPADMTGSVNIVSREPGVLAGLPIGELVLSEVDAECEWTAICTDGGALQPGTIVATLSGPVRSLLTAERTILNFLTHLSGIATLTRTYVDAVAGTKAVILDTRKTLPGWRMLQKYAVRCGGGTNHRVGLWDAVLIKDNHLAAVAENSGRSLADVVTSTREQAPQGVVIEIEVDSLEQLADAIQGSPDIVLLDNMDTEQLTTAVALRDREAPDVLLEASGGVNLTTVAEIARTGVDRISIGRLTHSSPSLDLGFDWL
ncbi:MAG: carboxylating nicotinate-nucleotide diphosphorylase [Planctomycetaceae bacterium]|nr:carboxylating nicotinate-nucleotide diphosphorylase [Planctomycetaceae bacterium]